MREAREALAVSTSIQLAPEVRRGCLDDLEAFALITGLLPPKRIAEAVAHADGCWTCHELIEGLCAAETSPSPVLETELPRAIDPLIGIEVGAYRIVALLAAGGMGRVYRATDVVLGREVALKVPRSRDPWLVRRFEREVAITARLGHPGIVPIHGAGTLADGRPFYVMQIIDGTPLDVALTRATNREQRLALLDHLVAVANTMAYVHDVGVAHRDLKPQNVLIGPFGETVVIDWGLAKDLTDSVPPARLTRSAPPPVSDGTAPAPSTPPTPITSVIAGRTTRPGDVFGTPAFMSPEQARGDEVDQRSDVYALGAMLEQLITGRLPRKAADAALAHAPPELVAICRRAMDPDREARYVDCSALAIELRAAARPRRAPSAPDVPAHPSRMPLLLTAIAGIALGIAISQLGWLG
ncbi:MAG: serine/threonine protein kinase [Myxococcales bacterium]|nr:serine/threonine protein kinase [Myxococcales bacterium]